jgi:hypothetical protein
VNLVSNSGVQNITDIASRILESIPVVKFSHNKFLKTLHGQFMCRLRKMTEVF